MHFNVESVIGEAVRQVMGRPPLPSADASSQRLNAIMARVHELVTGLWAQGESRRVPCGLRFQQPDGILIGCHQPMIAPCATCRTPVCLAHSFVSITDGSALCRACVQRAAGRPGPARARRPEPDTQRRMHLERLGLSGSPTEAEILAAFRTHAAKNHPDKAPSYEKAAAHKRFVELGQSRDFLLEQLRRAA